MTRYACYAPVMFGADQGLRRGYAQPEARREISVPEVACHDGSTGARDGQLVGAHVAGGV